MARRKKKPPTPPEPPAETPEQQTARLKQFVLDWCDGHIFSDRHCRSESDVRMSFMVLALAGPEVLESLKDTAIVYEHMSKAIPMSCNGNPIFFSCRTLTKAEWERVRPAIEAEEARRKELSV